jgi:methionine aminopeptidase
MIIVKSSQEIEAMRRAGAIVGQFFEEITRHVKPGVATLHLEEIAEEYVAKHGVKGAFKGYLGYPANLCTSINEEVVHGIPSGTRVLREGDIVSIDFGVVLNGFYGDAARTYAVGRISPDGEPAGGYFQFRPGGSGRRRILRRPGLRGTRNRKDAARGTTDPQLRNRRNRSEAHAGNGAGHRAHDQRGGIRCGDPAGRMDGGDA